MSRVLFMLELLDIYSFILYQNNPSFSLLKCSWLFILPTYPYYHDRWINYTVT